MTRGQSRPSVTGFPDDTDALIDHILARYHASHRAHISRLLPLAEELEAKHPNAPKGLSATLAFLAAELEGHLDQKERVLFPAMRSQSIKAVSKPLAMVRAEHSEQAKNLALVRKITNNLTPPSDACPVLCQLYQGLRQIVEDIRAHFDLETHVLFPRFDRVE